MRGGGTTLQEHSHEQVSAKTGLAVFLLYVLACLLACVYVCVCVCVCVSACVRVNPKILRPKNVY